MNRFLGMMTVIKYLYIHRIIQMFGGGDRKSGRIKGLYMYGSVGKQCSDSQAHNELTAKIQLSC